MKKVYYYEGQEYISLNELRRAMSCVSIPVSPQDTELTALGVTIYESAEKMEAKTLEQRKESKANEIRILAEQKVQAMQKGYTLGEISTFEQQYAGAAEILAKGVLKDILAMSENAQFVISLAQGRSNIGGVEITPETLAQKIADNYIVAKAWILKILSTQQGLEMRVRMAESEEVLETITWPDLV